MACTIRCVPLTNGPAITDVPRETFRIRTTRRYLSSLVERFPTAVAHPVEMIVPSGATNSIDAAGTGKGRSSSPLHDSHYFHFEQSFPESFHATPDTCAAACRDLIAAGVEDLKGNLINARVSVNTYLDRPREPVRLYPGPSSTKDEGVAHRGVIVALCVPPDPQLRRE